jgi:hypothetical protein
MYFPVTAWLPAFLLTLAIELPIILLLVRGPEVDPRRLGVLIVFANLATHLTVWYVITQLLLVGTLEYTLVAEGWATGAEALFYFAAVRGLSARRAVTVAVVANATSFFIGGFITERMPQLFS